MGFISDNFNILTTGTDTTSIGVGLLGGATIGGVFGGPYSQQALQQYQFQNYQPEPVKITSKTRRFIDELREEIKAWHGELK